MACISGCRGVVGFTVTTSVRPVREKVRPAGSGGGCEREKVRPLRSQWLKIGVIWRAGRSFSRKHRWRGCAGRIFSRSSSRGIPRGELCCAAALAAGPLLAVLTLQCAATPYWWHGGQSAQATTHPVNVRRMRSQRWGLERSQASRCLPYLQGNDRGGTPKDPASRCVRWPRCQHRKVGAEKSAPETQRPSLSSATVATVASRRMLSSSTSP